jgi:RNA polymerase sigma-70 factor, ECF subfamily
VRDASLESAFARRDASAYEAAYHAFGPRMHVAALRVLRDSDAARECVQDVFLHLWRSGSAYSAERGSLEAFLVVCARNRALTRVRGENRARETARRTDSPEDYTMEEDPIERERVQRALARLTEGQADVVRRAYYDGLTLAEVALDLAIPIGTVKGRLSAALRALRRELAVEGADGA